MINTTQIDNRINNLVEIISNLIERLESDENIIEQTYNRIMRIENKKGVNNER